MGQAWTLYSRALSEQPGDPETIRGLGSTLLKLQCFSSAAKCFALVCRMSILLRGDLMSWLISLELSRGASGYTLNPLRSHFCLPSSLHVFTRSCRAFGVRTRTRVAGLAELLKRVPNCFKFQIPSVFNM